MNAITPRSVFSDRLMLDVNGNSELSASRFGHLTRERANEVFDLSKATLGNELSVSDFWGNETASMSKAVTQATGLTYYDLRAPALNLFPTITPLRNRFARKQRANPGTALNYKTITSLAGSGFNWMGWVPEGTRAGAMTYTANNKSVSYVTIGEEDSLTDEAQFAAEGFEDEASMVQLRTLLKLMAKEEAGMLSGNATLALGTPTAPTLAAAGTGATLPALTYSVIVVALSQAAFMHATLAGGVPSTVSITPNGGGTPFVLNGGASMRSASATQAITLGQTLSATVPLINGAVAYAWYVGGVGAETLQFISTINSATFALPLAGARQAATVIAADYSVNAGLAYDGFLTTAFLNAPSTGSYVLALPTGVAGAGTQLTSSGYGSVVEVDTMLKTMWDTYRVSPTVIYVSSQEQRSISKLSMVGSGSAPLIRYNIDEGNANVQGVAGNVISFYFNPYSPEGGTKIPVKIHPNIAPGTIMAVCETLPPWYVQNETPAVAEVLTRKDYYTEAWQKVTRRQDYGIYCQSALAIYAPFAVAVITNIAPTT
ncbi:hypothetical protein [Sphingomonas sp. HMP6]|uniref:hypothetical protein n=1 Tax=Sphingomonas sp. HMP6 TaxID=1517551 RepID=UPI001596F4CD|nr:hypothetical protein [Sphingomonas sp. HMP6]BCA57690.1 hypothetical protein HMP06_0459 [Sphingomonas sp. HMP6]